MIIWCQFMSSISDLLWSVVSCYCIIIQCVVYYLNICSDLYCLCLVRLISLIRFACSYNQFHHFLFHFVLCQFVLLTNSCSLLIHVVCVVIHGMCLVFAKTSLPTVLSLSAVFFQKSGIQCQNHLSDLLNKYNY